MKLWKPVLLSFGMVCITACKSKSASADAENLPKDISQKPDWYLYVNKNISDESYETKLNEIKSNIEAKIEAQICDDASKWSFKGMGAKPCGGYTSYIAYPLEQESSIKRQIDLYNSLFKTYSEKKGLISDCVVTPEPISIRCEDGKAVLDYSESEEN